MPKLTREQRADPRDVEGLVRDISLGMTIRESAIANGFDPHALRVALARGRKTEKGKNRDLYLAVRRAQSGFVRSATAILYRSAKDGNATAMDRLLAKADAISAAIDADDVPEDPTDYMMFRLRDIRQRIASSSGIAYTNLIKQERDLVAEIERRAAGSGHDIDAADMTDEEWLEYHAEQANRLSVPELEVYVQAWAKEIGAVILTEGGRAHLRYRQTG